MSCLLYFTLHLRFGCHCARTDSHLPTAYTALGIHASRDHYCRAYRTPFTHGMRLVLGHVSSTD